MRTAFLFVPSRAFSWLVFPVRPAAALTWLVVAAALYAAVCASPAWALDHVTWTMDGASQQIAGRVVTSAADGGLLVEGRDGALMRIAPAELVSRTSDAEPFTPLSADEMAQHLKAELPQFEIHRTQRYLICHNTPRAYAAWCGALFEALHRAFTNYWSRRGFDLDQHEFPLVAIVFADQASYRQYAERDLKREIPSSMIGYYNLQSNRMVMYDLTGAAAATGARATTSEQINRVLSQPQAERTVATIVHEATHQIAFNSGFHRRYSDIPLWFSEGVAMYFEEPDLSSTRGWRTVGAPNRRRLTLLMEYLPARPSDSLRTLVTDDGRFRDPERSRYAYAEAWGLTYFLIRQHPREFSEYLKALAAKPPLAWDTPDERIRQFEAAFGSLDQLDAEFTRFASRLP